METLSLICSISSEDLLGAGNEMEQRSLLYRTYCLARKRDIKQKCDRCYGKESLASLELKFTKVYGCRPLSQREWLKGCSVGWGEVV